MKEIIKTEVAYRAFNSQPTWKDIKEFEFEDNDLITLAYCDDDFRWIFIVERFREETDAEYTTRIKQVTANVVAAREKRYQSYLRLKQEFETNKL